MVHPKEVSRQLKRIGARFQFWCRPEINELPKILFEGEQLEHVLVGWYEGGFALLCGTNNRVLLIDKKPFYLTIEDIRYDMISDVQYDHRLVNATVRLGTVNKTIAFTAYNHDKLRDLTTHIQEQVMVFRQQQNSVQAPVFVQTPRRPISQLSGAVLNAANVTKQKVVNPYNMPVMIRKRVSKFY